MKIVFIVSCLEAGRDGVGDYTTLLAGECERRGHTVRVLALNDPYVSQPKEDAGSLRLPSSLPWSERVRAARESVAAFAPDFVSLQFVCYGYRARGVDFALGGRLREIIGKLPAHIMFHELWIGSAKGSRPMERLVGGLQRACILRIIAALNVRVVHTNNESYVEMLQASGIEAAILPLFGSIPAPPPGLAARQADGTLALGIFGALHPVWPPEPLFSRLQSNGKKITLIHIGQIGSGGELWKKMIRDYEGRIEFKKLGEQPPEKIAEFFRTGVNFGIATTPWALIGKSASVAAMLEHGLPVIVNRDDWRLDHEVKVPRFSPLLIKMDGSLPEKLRTARRTNYQSMLPVIAGRFLGDLERTAP